MDLISGQKVKVADYRQTSDVSIRLSFDSIIPLDLSCFCLDSAGKMNEDYMIFFNQLQSPCKSIQMHLKPNEAVFCINLDKLPATIDKLVFTATIDGVGIMSKINQGFIEFDGADCRYFFKGSDLKDERALMIAEIYRKDGVWRLAAVGQGFNGGLDSLVKHFGGEVASTPVVPVPKAKVSLEKKFEGQPPALVSLAKKAQVSLTKSNLNDVQARVAIVLDASGSMSGQYRGGKVQEVLNRVIPLAVHFDDDGAMDSWAFADRCKKLPSISLSNLDGYVRGVGLKEYGGDIGIGCGNYEPCVIRDIIDFYKKSGSKVPTYVVFIGDGGIGSNAEITKLILEAASLPIFWQFVGIGGSSYGCLEKLDDIKGRIVDNCNFFALDKLSSVSEEKLYDMLLEEFPGWLKAAKAKGII